MGQSPATSNVITRVFMIKYKDHKGADHSGTGFTIEVENRQYLVTARHIVKDIKSGDSIEIKSNNGWDRISVNVIAVEPDGIDILVLALPRPLSFMFPIEPTIGGLSLGQDIYFFGFPYGLHMPTVGSSLSYPIPLMRSGMFIAFYETADEPCQLLIDGINNQGFSGGPIVFFDKDGNQKIAGVVSGFKEEKEPVLRKGDESKGEPEEVETGQFVYVNTGIVGGFHIHPALEAIKNKPIGALIKK